MSTSSSSKTRRSKPFSKIPSPNEAQHASRLLNLPPELRNRIYSFALQDTISYTLRKTKNCKRLHTIKPPGPSLVLACRQTYAEAIQMMHQQVQFVFDDLECLKKWKKRVGESRLRLVKTVHLKSPAPSFQIMRRSYWEPRHALMEFAKAAQRALQAAESELNLDGIELKADMHMPARMVEIVWTNRPVDLVAEVLRSADDRFLSRETYQAFEMLSRERAIRW